MQTIEREVCGCDYGGNSWTSRPQADALMPLLGLNQSSSLIDIGAGTGWPGLYLAKQSGCAVTLVDLPEIGLQVAMQRAQEEGLSDRVTARMADAADLPFPDSSFDAVSHSDLLCCLVRKRAVLQQCRKVIRANGRMAFTVISLAPGLNQSDHTRALDNAPDFIEAEGDYRALLEETGWVVTEVLDLTDEYRDCCARQIKADMACREELADLLGSDQVDERLEGWRSKLGAIQDGLFLRELYVCKPQT